MSYLSLPDVELYFEVHEAVSVSHHPPLLLIAGLASDAQSWQPVLEAARQNRRVILVDNRGSGRTETHASISLEQMAQDCIALVNHLSITALDVAGHSMGGFVSLHMARLASDRIRRLVLCNSSAQAGARNKLMFMDWADALAQQGATAQWYRTFFYWIFTRSFFDNQTSVEQMVKLAMSYPYAPNAAAFRSQVEAIQTFDATRWLSDIKTPTLVLAASEDLIFPPGDDASQLLGLPHARIKVLPNLAHSLPMEAPKAFIEEVLRFLDE